MFWCNCLHFLLHRLCINQPSMGVIVKQVQGNDRPHHRRHHHCDVDDDRDPHHSDDDDRE